MATDAFFPVPWAGLTVCKTPGELAALAVIASVANAQRGDPFEVAHSYLAQRSGLDVHQARRVIEKLTQIGVLVSQATREGRKPKQYVLSLSDKPHTNRIQVSDKPHTSVRQTAYICSDSTNIIEGVCQTNRIQVSDKPHTNRIQVSDKPHHIEEEQEQEDQQEQKTDARARVSFSPVMSGGDLIRRAAELVEARATEHGDCQPLLSGADSQALLKHREATPEDLELVWRWVTQSDDWEPRKLREGRKLRWSTIANASFGRRLDDAREWEKHSENLEKILNEDW